MNILNKSLLVAALLGIGLSADAQKKSKKNDPSSAMADTANKATSLVKSIADKIKSSTKKDGLFTLYQDTTTGSMQLYVKKNQLGKEFVYQSFSLGGPTNLFLNQNMIRTTFVFTMQKIYDKIQFLQPNLNFYYDPKNPVSKSANVDAQAAIFYSEKIVSEDEDGYLIPVDGLLISEKMDQIRPSVNPAAPPNAVFNLGTLSASKSTYESIRTFPENTDVVVKLVYDNGSPVNNGGVDITDARYNTIRFQHSFIAMPENDDFRQRRDDPRVGYFGAEVYDVTTTKAAPYKDFISRWKLVKKNPLAAISAPVEPIVFWIENTTPYEFRDIIKEAGEKWNEAFEKAGFTNAMVMKIMPDDADWDPADIRYNVIRWVSSAYPGYGAIGPSFFNPRTGQILGADITVEWKSGAGAGVVDDLYNGFSGIQKMPWQISEEEAHAQVSFNKNTLAHCQLAHEMQSQYQAGLAAIELLEDKPEAIKALHRDFLVYLIMHEIGHTLGLNHNMKASQMLSPADAHNKSITDKVGTVGSVMDYPSINVSLDRSKQGNYYTTKAGPYDLWAIEYGYTPFSAADEDAGLQKILNRSNEPALTFGNDADDMRTPGSGIDPRVMINDMSNDMPAYAEDRFKLVNNLIPQLKGKYIRANENYQLLINRFVALNNQRGQMATSLSRYIGGVYVDRSQPQQGSSNKPYTPVPEAVQKKALSVLDKYMFAPGAFDTDAQLFPYLQQQRRGFGFFGNSEDVKTQNIYAFFHRNLLAQFLHPSVLQRMSNSGLYGNTYSVSAFLTDLTKSFFNADLKIKVNVYRQNLQTIFVEGLSGIIDGGPGSNRYDNPAKAAALATLKKIKTVLAGAVSPDEQSRSHRTNLVYLIDKALTIK